MLHVTQPTLSRQIMQLEEELGVKLFVRSNHNIILTEAGMLLKRRAQELVALADKTKRDFRHKAEELAGEIAIGSGEFLSTSVFSRMMGSFRQEHPLVRYQIYSGNADNIRDSIERGLLDPGRDDRAGRYPQIRLCPHAAQRDLGRIGADGLRTGGAGSGPPGGPWRACR